MLSIGIVGLPNVGKSTIFKALTSAPAEASNYPFCTIDPNIGIVSVPDERLNKIAEVINPQRILPAAIQFVDIAGIIRGAHEGEGLGNKFLSHIRECEAIAEVVRLFEDENVVHVEGKTDPLADIETISYELALADLVTVDKRLERLKKEVRADPKMGATQKVVERVREYLEDGKPARMAQLSPAEAELVRDLHLLTLKPHLYIANVSEEQMAAITSGEASFTRQLSELSESLHSEVVPVCAKLEAELSELEGDEADDYRGELGYHDSSLSTVIQKSYALLGLISYFTAGEKEVRAWTIPLGATAPQAAGVIHTDFERGFIKAEVVSWEQLVSTGGWSQARSAGVARVEGKDYVFKDGDVTLFRFNV